MRLVSIVLPVYNEAETLVELGLPLLQDRRRRRDHDGLGLLAKKKLACNEAGLDRLSKAGVIGNEEIDARQAKRLAQRLHLVGINLYSGPEGRLKEVRIGGRNAVPP